MMSLEPLCTRPGGVRPQLGAPFLSGRWWPYLLPAASCPPTLPHWSQGLGLWGSLSEA